MAGKFSSKQIAQLLIADQTLGALASIPVCKEAYNALKKGCCDEVASKGMKCAKEVGLTVGIKSGDAKAAIAIEKALDAFFLSLSKSCKFAKK
ncbi:hypothetical protein AAEX28_06680 [Lentisphaerota bacterium WC36G]|nr:hypothetical protein LJT99_09545 [Lentisphaerae bacterium WC36]